MDLGKCHDSLESSSSWSTIASHKLSDEIEDLNEIEDSVVMYLQCLGVKMFSDPTHKEFLYNQVQKDKFVSDLTYRIVFQNQIGRLASIEQLDAKKVPPFLNLKQIFYISFDILLILSIQRLALHSILKEKNKLRPLEYFNFQSMGCINEKQRQPSIVLQNNNYRQELLFAYNSGTVFVDFKGNRYHIIKDGNKFRKVPILKELRKNSLFSRRKLSLQEEVLTRNCIQ